jgi:hypothetical protein
MKASAFRRRSSRSIHYHGEEHVLLSFLCSRGPRINAGMRGLRASIPCKPGRTLVERSAPDQHFNRCSQHRAGTVRHPYSMRCTVPSRLPPRSQPQATPRPASGQQRLAIEVLPSDDLRARLPSLDRTGWPGHRRSLRSVDYLQATARIEARPNRASHTTLYTQI